MGWDDTTHPGATGVRVAHPILREDDQEDDQEDDIAVRDRRGSRPAAGSRSDAEFRQCFQTYAAGVRLTAHLLCGDWHRAEDLTQSVFLKLYLTWSRVHMPEHLGGYLRRITVRTFLADQRRMRWRRERLVDQPPEPPPGDTGFSADKLLAWQALGTLPPRQRAVLVLRFWQDLGVTETAALLGCSTGTVKSQTAKGLATLRRQLSKQYADRIPAEIPADAEGRDADA